jgi:uncharacterized protein YutE (UPF0331/DUF86 family)/predicted nucleotidyltransferase
VDVVRAVEGVVSVYLFGSFAEGREHAESDVDVGVLLDRAVYPTDQDRFDCRVLLSTHLSDAARRPADVVILNDVPPQLARAIVTRGERIYCTDAAIDHAFVRDAQLLAADSDPEYGRDKLRTHLSHLRELRPRVTNRTALDRDLSLRNDVLYSLLTISQIVIGIAGKFSDRRFGSDAEAIRNLRADSRFPADVVEALQQLPGFRNVLVHEYVSHDMDRVMRALENLAPVEQFAEIVATIERDHPI